MAGGGLEDETGVAGEADLAAAFDPALVDGDGGAVVADAGSDVALAGRGADDEAEDAEAVGGDGVFAEAAAGSVAFVHIERTGGEEDECEGDEEFVLGLGFDLTFGVEGEFLAGGGVGSGERGLDVLGGTGGEDELAEVEVESAGAAEAAGGLGLSDGSDHGGAFGDGDGVVGVVDGFGDGGFDLLAGFGGGGAERLAEIGLDDPGFGGGVLGSVRSRRWCGRLVRYGSFSKCCGLGRDGERFGGFYGPGGLLFDALGMVGELGIEELDEAVFLVGTGEDGDAVAGELNAHVPILADEPTLARRRRDEAVDGSAIGCGAGGYWDGGAVGEDDGGEVNDGDAEGGEVGAKT